jgi:hydrogenase nickel incorporation protein HypB
MCTTCGCGSTETHEHVHADGRRHHHSHELNIPLHRHDHNHETRIIAIESDILAKNDRLAAGNRAIFEEKGIFVLNLVSSPGSGKTTLLERTLTNLKDKVGCAVIEGDQQTSNDADRIAATGVPVRQINTGAGCHLDAHMVSHALEQFDLVNMELLFVENVGNLVCPAAFDLGEDHKVVVLSVTEGEDKPLKYPQMFHNSTVMLLNKIDLLPHLDFDVAKCLEMARRVNPGITIFQLSARTGEGMAEWYGWLEGRMRGKAGTGDQGLEARGMHRE